MQLVPLTVEHALRMVPQPHQADDLARLRDSAKLAEVIGAGPSWAACDGERVLAVGGIADAGGGRGIAWCLIASNVARFMPGITKAAKRCMDASGFRRIEIATCAGWLAAERWAIKLGFSFEGPSQGYFEDGGEAWRWGRVRG